MITNFFTLVCFIGGEHCLTARAWKKAIEHAKRHQALYKKYEREHECFYVSLCDDLHRRTQTCIHSGAAGKAEEVKKHHLDFNNIFDDIEFHKYFVRRPQWLPRKKNNYNNNSTNGTKNNQQNDKNGNDRPTNRRRFGRGDLVTNENQHDDMKVPAPGTYHEVFSPEYIRGLKYVHHSDGGQMCNNYHFRGRCHTKCERKDSHNKKLNAEEVAAGHKFVMAAFKNWQNNKTEEPKAKKARLDESKEEEKRKPAEGEAKG